MPLLQQVLEKYPEDVKLVFKNFPLRMHAFARKAATAALAAHRQGKFWEFHDQLFQNIETLNDENIRRIGRELGLDMEKFDADLKDPAIQQLIVRDMRDGYAAGVRGTPSVFINGKLLGSRSLQGFSEMIDAELGKRETDEPQPRQPLEKEAEPAQNP